MRFKDRVKHPINRRLIVKLVLIILLLVSVFTISALFISKNLKTTSDNPIVDSISHPQLISTDSCSEVVIGEIVDYPKPHICKEKIVYEYDTVVVRDTIIKYKYVLGLDTVHYKYIDRHIDRTVYVDTCETKCKYWYVKHFNRHRYPEHGPLWELDSILECK